MRKKVTIRTLKAQLKRTLLWERKLKNESKKLDKNLRSLKNLMRKKGYKV